MPALDPVQPPAPAQAADAPLADAREAEVARVMHICNACRYCEGFCAVFPAMTRRLAFGQADVHYLANLCHNCGACLHACQYAPPHEFSLNVPLALARVRAKTYTDYAWPSACAALYRRNGLTLTLALTAALAGFMLLALQNTASAAPGDFFGVFGHQFLVALFGAVGAWVGLALGLGVRRFWRDQTPGMHSSAASKEALKNVLTLKYLDGGHGQGCNDADDAFSLWRRRLHHFSFYGFGLCFAATLVASFYHYVLGLHAPYAPTSLPVLLGTLGGIGLLIGPAGLLWLHHRRHPLHGDAAQAPMDRGFMVLLWLSGLTGLALLLWRSSSVMALLLTVHLAVVLALLLTLPYGKFAHAVYRSAALLKWAIERRQRNRLQLGDD
ncbi:MAG: tricarballylate utilization 4Fe-4S protein TcuB [Rhodoferax sp.]